MSPSRMQAAVSTPAPEYAGASSYEFDVSHTDTADRRSFIIRWGGYEVLEDIPIVTPNFSYTLLKYCVSGAGLMESDDGRWEITAGDVFWSAAHQPNVLKSVGDGGMRNFAVALKGRDTDRDVERLLHGPIGVAKLKRPQRVASVMQAIMEEGLGSAEHREENCVLLARLLLNRVADESDGAPMANPLARQTFKRCRDYIDQHFASVTSLTTVAEATDVTVPYLCRLFDQFFECSPYEYMTRLKMRRAESLLLRPGVPVGDVAVAVGYKDPRLFARNFKAAFGTSPTKYRRLHVHAAAE